MFGGGIASDCIVHRLHSLGSETSLKANPSVETRLMQRVLTGGISRSVCA